MGCHDYKIWLASVLWGGFQTLHMNTTKNHEIRFIHENHVSIEYSHQLFGKIYEWDLVTMTVAISGYVEHESCYATRSQQKRKDRSMTWKLASSRGNLL